MKSLIKSFIKSKSRKSGVTLAEALIMIMVAGTLMVPIIGTMQQGVNRTNSFELRAAMQNFAESKLAEISYQSLYQGIAPVTQTASLNYPNSTDPEYIFDLQVEVLPSATITGDNAVIDGAQHSGLCAVSISVALRDSGIGAIPDVEPIDLLTMVCPPPPPPDMIFCALPATKKIAIVNPINHELINELPVGAETPVQLALHPNGRWLAIKCPAKILMMNVDTTSGDYGSFATIYSSAGICGASIAETGDGSNNARKDRGIVFRSDGKYLYFTHDTSTNLVALTAPSVNFSIGTLGTWGVLNSWGLGTADSYDLKMLDDGTLAVARGAANANAIVRLDTHHHQAISTYAGGADSGGNALQLAIAHEWGGNNMYARLGLGKVTSLMPDSPTSFIGATIGGDFTIADTAQNSVLVSNDNRWLIMSDGTGGGASADCLMAFKLPITTASLQDDAVSRLVERGPSGTGGAWPITQLEYSPFREEIIAKTSDNTLLFPNIHALTSGNYPLLNDIKPAVLTLTGPASDVKGRIAEYVWIGCSDNAASHKVECLDLYGGNNTNGVIISDNAVTLTAKPNSVALNAAGNEAVVSYNTGGQKPKKLNCANHSVEDFANPLTFTASGVASKSVFLLDGSLLVITSSPACATHSAGDFYPGMGLTSDDMHNGFLLYDIDDTNGSPKAQPCLGFVAPGAGSGFRVKDVTPMHRKDGAYVLMSRVDQTDSILLWIEKSRTAGYTPQVATDSYRIMGYWRQKHDNFPGRSPVKMALSADDTILALYDNLGNGAKQVIRFYDLNNNHFPTTAGLAYTRYKTTGYNPSASDSPLANTYYKDPYTVDLPFKPQNSITASTSLNMDPNNYPGEFAITDVAGNDDLFYGLSGYFYHDGASYVGFKSHDGVRVAKNGYYLYRNSISGTREPWADNSGDQYFSYVFDSATGSSHIQLDYFSNDDGLGALFGYSSANITSANWATVTRAPAQDFRPFKYSPPLIKELLLDGSATLPNLVSSTSLAIIMTFSRDSAIPALFFIDTTTKILHTYNPFYESLHLYNGTVNQFRIDLTLLGATSFNDIAVSPDGRRLLVASTEGAAGAIYTMKLDYDTATAGRIVTTAINHTLLTKQTTDKPALFIASRPFNSFSSARNIYPGAVSFGVALANGYGSQRAAVASGGIYLFGGAPGIEADPDSKAIFKIDAKCNSSLETTTLTENLKDFAVVPFDEGKFLLFGGQAPLSLSRPNVSVYDPLAKKFSNAFYEAMRNDTNSEKNKLYRHGAAATPFGPMVMGGTKGDPASIIDIDTSTSWNAHANTINNITIIADPLLQLSDGSSRHGSYFLNQAFPITASTSFSASFKTIMQAKDGITFCVHNDPRGANALGDNDNDLGYSGAIGAKIVNSAALWMEAKVDKASMILLGNKPGFAVANEYYAFASEALGSNKALPPKSCWWWVVYDGQRNMFNIWANLVSNDPETAVWIIKDYSANLETIVGGAGNSAYFGFTGASNDSPAVHKVQDWKLKIWEKAPYTTTFDKPYKGFTSVPTGFTVLGSPVPHAHNGEVIRLTDGSDYDMGSFWYNTAMDLDSLGSFRSSFAIAMWTGGENGMAFLLQGNGSSVSPSATASSLGYGGILNSAIVEFDTYPSGAPDPNGNHVTILKNGDATGSHFRTNVPGWTMNDSSTRVNWVWVEYDNPSNNLRVYITSVTDGSEPAQPSTPSINHVFSTSLSTIVGGNQFWLGFTGRQGNTAPQTHDVMSWKLESNNIAAAVGGITDEVKAYYPNAISDHLPAVAGQLSKIGTNAAFETDAILLNSVTTTGQIGAVWLTDPVSVDNNTSFSSEFVVNMDPTGGASPFGDGMSFTIQGNSASTIGGGGNDMGYGGITNSLTLEMDTCIGGGESTGDNHLAITKNGDELTHLGPAITPATDMNDGKDKFIWVDYDGSTNNIKVYINTVKEKPGTASIDYNTGSELTTLLGGGTNAYFGFTSSTGLYTEAHRVKAWKLAVDNDTKIWFPKLGETLGATSLPAGLIGGTAQPAGMINGTAVTHYSRKDKKYYLYYVGPGSALGTQFDSMIYKYSFDAGTWTPIALWHATNKINVNYALVSTASEKNKRTQVAACSWGDEIFIFGGHYTTTNIESQKALAFNPDTNTFRELADLPAVRNQATAVPYGPYIFLIGGSTSYNGLTGATNTMWRYKP